MCNNWKKNKFNVCLVDSQCEEQIGTVLTKVAVQIMIADIDESRC